MPGKKRKKSRTRDELRHLLLVFFAAIFTITLILFATALGYRSTQSELHRDERLLLFAREVAHKARFKSDELHHMAMEAVSDGDSKAIQDYEKYKRPEPTDADFPIAQIVAPWHGRGGRNDPRGSSSAGSAQGTNFLDLLEKNDVQSVAELREELRRLRSKAAFLSSEEVEKFENAIKASKAQAEFERKALNALQGVFQDKKGEYTVRGQPDQTLASQILSDPEYNKTVRAVQSDFSSFLSALDVRLFGVHKESAKNFRINFVIVLIAALAIATPVFYLLLLRSLNTSIRGLKITARKLTDELGQVNTELKAAITSREDYRRRLEQAEAASNRIIPAPQQDSRLHDVQEPELQDYLTRLP